MVTSDDLNIFWTVLGEKRIIGGRSKRENYTGRLIISGVVKFENGELKYVPYFVKE